ncbi:MAG: DNA topoisomerase IV, partial [Epsilonproteobacteria bacterium]|nr:DNA topoisomerase IV [Campylobacterota bacterium]
MKILLLNDNPVVTKLVTLSAQKTSDELDIVESIEELESKTYDLFAIDDNLYTKEIMDEVKSKTKYKSSLYICSRDAENTDEFEHVLKKPFLPTDLVELLATIGNEMDTLNLDETEIESEDIKTQELDDLDLELGSDSELDLDTDLDLDELSLDDISDDLDLDKDLDAELDTDIELDAGLSMDDLSIEDDEFSDSILDKEELQEVQDLLDETEISDDLDIDDSNDELELGLESEEVVDDSNDELELELESEEVVDDSNDELEL